MERSVAGAPLSTAWSLPATEASELLFDYICILNLSAQLESGYCHCSPCVEPCGAFRSYSSGERSMQPRFPINNEAVHPYSLFSMFQRNQTTPVVVRPLLSMPAPQYCHSLLLRERKVERPEERVSGIGGSCPTPTDLSDFRLSLSASSKHSLDLHCDFCTGICKKGQSITINSPTAARGRNLDDVLTVRNLHRDQAFTIQRAELTPPCSEACIRTRFELE